MKQLSITMKKQEIEDPHKQLKAFFTNGKEHALQ